MLEIDLYKNMISTSKTYGMVYGRVDNKQTYTLDDLAEHMHEHNTPFSAGCISGVLRDMVACVRELCLEGNCVKIDDLAIFKCAVETRGANSYLDFDLGRNVRHVRLKAVSTGEFRRAELDKDCSLGYTRLARERREEERPKPTPDEGGGGE